ncbi:MAG: adenylate/guanylate cyclase domain-containing protein [Chlamydiales bacterium]
MKLLPKLLLGIGCLFLLLIIVLSLFPIFFVRKDIQKTTKAIEALLIKNHQELIRSNAKWLKYELTYAENNLKDLLPFLYRDKALLSKLAFTADNPPINSWKALGTIAGFNPEIGYLQIYSPRENKAAVILSHEASLHPVLVRSQENGAARLFFVGDHADGLKEYAYTAVPVPLEESSSYKFYALIEPTGVAKPLETEKTEGITEENRELKMEMIEVLIPLYVEGLNLNETKEQVAGLAKVDAEGKGFALLSDEIFATTPFFQGEVQRFPIQSEVPISTETTIMHHSGTNHFYLTNTLLFDSNALTIASQIGTLAKRLAYIFETNLLVHVNEELWIGYNEKGEVLSKTEVAQMLTEGLLEEKSFISNQESAPYFLSPIGSFFNGNLVFFGVYSLENQLSVINTLNNFEDTLAERISLQLALIALLIMIAILLFAIRFAMSVIYPVKRLAQATEDVVSGKYEEIHLPEIGKRKDEVAILTQSFAEMIKGLQEKEKIRGVLNKVVSKDVAEEILKSQIHLGGEDRVVSILFSDIRQFTELTRDFSPQKTIEILNLCMTKISHVIEGEGGVIDKYVGDEVMALFGAPTYYPDHALRAISTAMLIIETLRKWNQERESLGETVLEMGIGVHTGLVVAGNMGAENRLNYTVLGTNVNLAARLCQVAKSYQLIISQDTLDEPNIKDYFHVNPLPPLTLKGFAEPVQNYEVTGFKWENTK